MKRFLCLLITCTSLVLFLGCSSQYKLTVTSINQHIILDETTTEELIDFYGKPHTILRDKKLVEKVLDEDLGKENSIGEDLHYTDFYTSHKVNSTNAYHGSDFDSCYEYRNMSTGLEYIRFYIYDDKVSYVDFGDITNVFIARQDKYLRQIIEE